MKLPPFTSSKYLFALHFKVKFPALPTSELALAFRPPYPKWLPCDSLLGMRQKLITKEKDKVTWTKFYLDNFRGSLHLNFPHIKIISPIGVDTKYFDSQIFFKHGLKLFRENIEKTTYLFARLFVAVSLKSGDEEHDGDEHSQKPSKSKSGKSSKQKKIPKAGKRKTQHSREITPDETVEPAIEKDVSIFSLIDLSPFSRCNKILTSIPGLFSLKIFLKL
jgi:hypothetical protein